MNINYRLSRQSILIFARFIVIGCAVGVLAGASSAGFLASLEWATETRIKHGWLLWLLPLAGLLSGLAYHILGRRCVGGNNLILNQIHNPTTLVPARLAPLVYVTTVVTHLFGGSAGREGTAIQMSGSLADAIVTRLGRFSGRDRQIILVTAISGGFGAVFGVPFAGCIFGLEVHSFRRIRHEAIVPALAASVIGDQVVRVLGVHHTHLPKIPGVALDPLMLIKLTIAGCGFGAVSWLFVILTDGVKALLGRFELWPPLKPMIGGVAVIALTGIVGTRDYLGLSVPLIVDSLNPAVGVTTFAFALKLLFTAVTLGAGFQGGEVTPLFVIGATMGATLADWLDVSAPMLAAVGLVAVFAGATNTPIACAVMGVEMFGAGAIVPFAIGAVTAAHVSGHHTIYPGQHNSAASAGREDIA